MRGCIDSLYCRTVGPSVEGMRPSPLFDQGLGILLVAAVLVISSGDLMAFLSKIWAGVGGSDAFLRFML